MIAIAMLSPRTGRPEARAKSSSWETLNSAELSPTPTSRMIAPSPTVSHRSVMVTVEIDPKRYDMRFALVPPAIPMISTPPAMPP